MDPHRSKNPFSRFFLNKYGNFTIKFALGMTVIFMAAGLAVDYSMSLGTKTRINNALDAATLATARALASGEFDTGGTHALDYFKAVFAANVGDDAFDSSTYTVEHFTIDAKAQTVSGEISTDQWLTLSQIGTGRTTQTVASSSTAGYGVRAIEVAMVLDLSSSMKGSKLSALKTAAKDSIETFLSANTNSRTNVRISLIPYSSAVNVGSFLARYVYADYSEATSNAPTYDASDDGTNVDNCSTDRKAPSSGTSYRFTDANPSFGMISRDSRLEDDKCLTAELVPLSSNESSLVKTIKNYRVDSGTAGQIGLQWAWYTISHNWANYLPNGSEPGVLSTDSDLAKYIILMTDGQFNKAYAGNSDSSEISSSIALATANSLCTAIKSDGIIIFSIGFKLDKIDAKEMLKSCATPDRDDVTYFYEPDTNNELLAAYSNIVQTIQRLNLVE